MKVRELIASLGRVARRNSPPETDGGGELNTDNDARRQTRRTEAASC